MWTMGFLVSLASAVIALLSYLSGTPWYRYVKPSGYPVIRPAQVFVASCRKWKVVRSSEDQLYEVEGPESALKGRMKILQSNDLGFLNKAAMVTENDMIGPKNPWRLCTITQVEEAKCVLRMIPIWLCTIIYSVVFTQMDSLFVKQGDVMNSYIDKFLWPAASMSAFDICSVLLCTELYHQILVPLAGRTNTASKYGNGTNNWNVSNDCSWCHRSGKAQTVEFPRFIIFPSSGWCFRSFHYAGEHCHGYYNKRKLSRVDSKSLEQWSRG
ncbi:hypothetical protein L6164_006444 [Bauhinia variegata]|uniref:Uncharacterized protein n=1 Tax=Bauhinia variegata TaxID=167791 RepID=A0ACB9PUH1_BAUVA|nr:hypothetical protein L6164_006444 [Bauhinia variegata]